MRRARSTKEFASKLQIVNEEIDESAHWLDVLAELAPELCPDRLADVRPLLAESRELRSIFAKARSTTRRTLERGG